MSQKILVAIDRADDTNKHVFQEAFDLAKATGASLKLVHVLSVDEKNSPNLWSLLDTPDHKKRWEEFEKPSRELLLSLCDRAMSAGIPTEYYLGIGRPGQVICETAKTWEADTIVIGRRGLSGLGELILGSVSNYVAHYAPCSVLLIHDAALARSSTKRQSDMATQV
jgi:nucleotide-binding universal stress UspA family protein